VARAKHPEKRGRGRPAGPPTEAITVRIPVTIMERVRAKLARDESDSLTAFVARALLDATRP
jgi:hypothetical protein